MRETSGSVSAVPAGRWGLGPGSARVELATHVFGTTVQVVFDQVDGLVNVGSDPLDSSISMSVQAASLDSGNRRRDNHLRSHLGLDVRRFPVIVFTGSAVAFTDGGTMLVAGELAIRGRRVPLTLPVDIRNIDDCRTALLARSEITVSALGIGLAVPFGQRLLGSDLKLGVTASAVIDHCMSSAA